MNYFEASCKCPLKPRMDWDTLINEVLPHNCKGGHGFEPGYICTNLDKELVRARTEKDRKEAYEQRKAQRNKTT